MGVADIMSRWGVLPSPAGRGGRFPFSRNARRWPTPKRCCSSTTVRVRFLNATPAWNRAWVPTATSTSPAAISARVWRLALPFRAAASQATVKPRGVSHSWNLR